MATLIKRPNGWQARIRRKGVTPFSRTFPKRILAERWARAQEYAIQAGEFQDKDAERALTVKALLIWYEDTISSKHLGAVSEGYRIGRLGAGLGEYPVVDLAPMNVVDYALGRMERRWRAPGPGIEFDSEEEAIAYRNANPRRKIVYSGISGPSIKRELTILADAIDSGAAILSLNVTANPVRQARRILSKLGHLSRDPKRDRRLSEEEEGALMDAPMRGGAIQDVTRFALETGMREGEIAAMVYANVDWERHTYRIARSKTDRATGERGRVIPLSPIAIEILRRRPEKGRLWPYMNGHAISQAFTRLCRRAGVNGLHFHDLRHEATSRLFERGYQIQEVAQITGHKDWRSLARYTHLRAEDLARKMRRNP